MLRDIKMNAIELLDASNSLDHQRWIEIWNSWAEREVMAHPDYVWLFKRDVDRAMCAAFRRNDSCILFPFILRPLGAEPWAKDSNFLDITTPYGYGGAFKCFYGDFDPEEFWESFSRWAGDNHVVSMFCRLSLFPEQVIPFSGKTVDMAPNVVRNLEIPIDKMWYDYEHKVRKNVNRAVKSGISCKIDPNGEHLEDFLKIYYTTMSRRSASKGYYFPETFFKDIVHKLSGYYVFFHALENNQIVSTELVLCSINNIYSFLGGTREDAFPKRPNDVLKHEIIKWGISNGKKSFVLGGGYSAADGIFKYKKSFAPNGICQFRVINHTFDEDNYEMLVNSRREWEESNGRRWEPAEDFFPAYRSSSTLETDE